MSHEEQSTCTFYFVTAAYTYSGLQDGMGSENSFELQPLNLKISRKVALYIRMRDQKSGTQGTQGLSPYLTTASHVDSVAVRARGSLAMSLMIRQLTGKKEMCLWPWLSKLPFGVNFQNGKLTI